MFWTCLVLILYNVVSQCVALGFESTVLATNNLSSITALPATASPSCGGCSVEEYWFEFDWYSEVFTHIAATVVKFINNSTNATRTSTIHASDFVLPSSASMAGEQVSDVVITTDIGGINYTLTYPTVYQGITDISSFTQFLITDQAGHVSCVSKSVYITRNFLRHQYASIDELYSTYAGRSCGIQVKSPPMWHVAVLSLTQTETSLEQLPARQTSAARKATPSKPTIAPTVNPTRSFEAKPRETPLNSPVVASGPTKPNTSPQTILNVGPSSPPSPKSLSLDRGSASDKDLPPLLLAASPQLQPSRTSGQNTESSKDNSIFNPVNNPPESDTPNSPDNIATLISPNGGNMEPSNDFATDGLAFGGQLETRPTPTPQLVLSDGSSIISADFDGNFIADQTLIAGGPPITALGKSIYLQPSKAAAVIDGSTVILQQAPFELSYPTPPMVLPIGSSRIAANPEGNFVIGSQTLVAGGSPVTALGKSIYLQPSGSAAVIDGSTVALDQALPVLTFGSQTFEQEKAGRYIIGSQTLIAGGAPITVAGTPVSLAPSAPALAFGLTTIIHKAKPGALVFGNQLLVPDGTGGYALGSQILFPGQAPITIEGTALSLAPSASELIIGSKTLTPRPAPSFPTVVIHRVSAQANTASELLIAGQTLVAGAPPISIDGQPVSLAPGESQVVIGSSTKTLSSADSGLASLILQGFGKIGSDATPTRPKANTISPTLSAQYTGSAGLGKYSIVTTWIGLSVLLMGLGVIT